MTEQRIKKQNSSLELMAMIDRFLCETGVKI